jgi:hypothetical protein
VKRDPFVHGQKNRHADEVGRLQLRRAEVRSAAVRSAIEKTS